MKPDKKTRREALFDCLLELVLTVIFFGIGALMIHLFGVKLDSPNLDFELIVLIGILTPVALFGVIDAAVKTIRKRIKEKRK